MNNIKIKEPAILKNLFSPEDFKIIRDYLFNRPKTKNEFDENFQRYRFTDPVIDEYAIKLIPIAKKIFDSNSLLPSYSLFAQYEGNSPSLYRHKDNNACTYTIDMCLYQSEPWALWVSHNSIDTEYILKENEALAYYGNDQEHWRNKFPNPNNQHVAMIFFHFVESDHWFFKYGPEYLNTIIKEGNKVL
jgi:hypothetical protein